MPKKLEENIALERVLEKCKEKNLEFRGWVGDKWNGTKNTKIVLFCKTHSYEWNSTTHHTFFSKERGCHICKGGIRLNEDEVISTINKICNDVGYEFRGFVNGKYTNSQNTFLILYCRKCDYKWTTTNHNYFMRTQSGCILCKGEIIRKTKTLSIDIVQYNILQICNKHKYLFNGFVDNTYKKTKDTYLKLYCSKCKIRWETTSYDKFVNGRKGCPKCRESKLEKTTGDLLDKDIIKFIPQHTFKWLINPSTNYRLSLDFYLLNYNIAIECQGKQHFEISEYWGGERGLKERQDRDQLKKQLCEENGVKLYYINYNDNVEEKLNQILEEIGYAKEQ